MLCSKAAGNYAPPNLRIVDAEPPLVYLQPYQPDVTPPVLMVGGIKVVIEDKKRAAQWARLLTDWALSD